MLNKPLKYEFIISVKTNVEPVRCAEACRTGHPCGGTNANDNDRVARPTLKNMVKTNGTKRDSSFECSYVSEHYRM